MDILDGKDEQRQQVKAVFRHSHKVLALLVLKRDHWLSMREIANAANLSLSLTIDATRILREQGLVKVFPSFRDSRVLLYKVRIEAIKPQEIQQM